MSFLLLAKTIALFVLTALAEIIGCYLPYLWLKKEGSPWLLVPAILSLMAFVWLLTLHPAESGRTYAAYGGIYVISAVMWLKWVDGVSSSLYDVVGVALVLAGMSVLALGWAQN